MRESWRDEALCASPKHDPNLWFADPDEEDTPDERDRTRLIMYAARDICRMCPVRLECLEYAMYRPFLVGIWGGLSTRERATLRQIRARKSEEFSSELKSEPDLTMYLANMRGQTDTVVRGLRARRICPECKEEKDYYISRQTRKCDECLKQASEHLSDMQ